jgi:hypothetical protein
MGISIGTISIIPEILYFSNLFLKFGIRRTLGRGSPLFPMMSLLNNCKTAAIFFRKAGPVTFSSYSHYNGLSNKIGVGEVTLFIPIKEQEPLLRAPVPLLG